MPEKFNELLLKQDIKELYNAGITPDYGYLMNGRFEKDMITTLYPLNKLSGNPIAWEASGTEYLFPSVSFVPKQEGSGDPSPDNVRPITEYDSLSLTRCGKNLLNPLYTTRNRSNIFWGKDSNGIRVEKGKTYTLSNSKNQNYAGIYVKDKGTETTIFSNYSKASLTFTPSDTETVFFEFYSTDAIEEDNELMLELGSTPTDYEPFQGDTYDIALPETVYGGTVDCVTGVGNDTWYYKDFNGQEKWSKLENDDGSFFYFGETSAPLAQNNSDGVCSHFGIGTVSYTSNDFMIQLPYTIGRIWRIKYGAMGTADELKAYLATQASAGTPVQVAYKVATPEPFQATGNRQLTSLVGYNTIYTTGESITLSRKVRRLEV